MNRSPQRRWCVKSIARLVSTNPSLTPLSCKVDIRRHFPSLFDRDLGSCLPQLFVFTTILRNFRVCHRRRPLARRRHSLASRLARHNRRHRPWVIPVGCRRRRPLGRRRRFLRMPPLVPRVKAYRHNRMARKKLARMLRRCLARRRTRFLIQLVCARRLPHTLTNGLASKSCHPRKPLALPSCNVSSNRGCLPRTRKSASCASWLNSPSRTASGVKSQVRRRKRHRSSRSPRLMRMSVSLRDWFAVKKKRWHRDWPSLVAPWLPSCAPQCETRMNEMWHSTPVRTSAPSPVYSTRCTPRMMRWIPPIRKYSPRLQVPSWRCNRSAYQALRLLGSNSCRTGASCLVF
mmetsp:Transcript_2107/g.7864  ORF Transcript_2107/g.7864 Transcript_2107/m.7864 type:complete len:346 (-) Transcript_2107:1151-2188(-)